MQHLGKQSNKIWLGISEIHLGVLSSSVEIRYTLTGVMKNLLQMSSNYVISDTITNYELLSEIKEFLKLLQNTDHAYKSSLSRQFAADLPPNIKQTSLKDEPKDWFIKTADFGDDCDRVLQHRDGEYTQLLEDIAHYHQIFQQGYDKIILLRPPTYTGYDIQLVAAMQCLGYTKEQFQFIIVQPIKLYAFHKPTQQIHPIPDIPTNELIQAIGMDALRWHSFSVPLTDVAPINISTAGQPTAADPLYRVQTAHARCCALLQEAHQQGTIQLNTSQRDDWQIAPAPMPLAEYTWNNSHAKKLASQVLAVPDILQQSAAEIAPHLVIRHLEAISNTCHQWLDALSLTPDTCILLLATKQAIFDLLENVLGITAPEKMAVVLNK